MTFDNSRSPTLSSCRRANSKTSFPAKNDKYPEVIYEGQARAYNPNIQHWNRWIIPRAFAKGINAFAFQESRDWVSRSTEVMRDEGRTERRGSTVEMGWQRRLRWSSVGAYFSIPDGAEGFKRPLKKEMMMQVRTVETCPNRPNGEELAKSLSMPPRHEHSERRPDPWIKSGILCAGEQRARETKRTGCQPRVSRLCPAYAGAEGMNRTTGLPRHNDLIRSTGLFPVPARPFACLGTSAVNHPRRHWAVSGFGDILQGQNENALSILPGAVKDEADWGVRIVITAYWTTSEQSNMVSNVRNMEMLPIIASRTDSLSVSGTVGAERKASKEPEGTDPKRVNPDQTTGFESIKVGEKINPNDDPKGKGKAPEN
ncbi:hypothetical protein B0H13DRAFT_2273087 [Mycena leptocephala]|nr:hypothetical protein B0H13DRAFT_2273087 [Mycena leptocephala]